MVEHSLHNSNTFLAYYNHIDKYFAYLLQLKRYLPFAEKVTMLTNEKYSIHQFVRLYQNKLRYFGDLRNQLVHGFRLENQHYVLASNHAVQEIQKIYQEMKKPTNV